jgi:hypothetical protein
MNVISTVYGRMHCMREELEDPKLQRLVDKRRLPLRLCSA